MGMGLSSKNTRNNPGLVESAAAKGTSMRQPRAIIKMNNRDNRGRRWERSSKRIVNTNRGRMWERSSKGTQWSSTITTTEVACESASKRNKYEHLRQLRSQQRRNKNEPSTTTEVRGFRMNIENIRHVRAQQPGGGNYKNMPCARPQGDSAVTKEGTAQRGHGWERSPLYFWSFDGSLVFKWIEVNNCSKVSN